MKIGTLMPTRSRAARALEAHQSHEETKDSPDTEMIVVLDSDDSAFETYEPFLKGRFYVTHGNMVERTNKAAMAVLGQYDLIGWTADDQIYRTYGWDTQIKRAFEDPNVAFVYTNDLHYGAEKPINIYTRPKVIKALGWLALPNVNHLYVDNAWKMLGDLSNSLVYLEDVIVEHMHPVYGKAEDDDQYAALHAQAMYEHDYDVYDEWRKHQCLNDVNKVVACLG